MIKFQKSLERIERSNDNRFGLISSVNELAVEPDDPKIFHYSAMLTNIQRYVFHGCNLWKSVGGGVGLKREEAKMAALCECIERYSCGVYIYEDLIFSTYNELLEKDINMLKSDEITLFSEKQYKLKRFPFDRFTFNSKINWVWGFSLINKKPILVPASLVFMPYVFPDRMNGEKIIAPAFSTGLSCRETIEEAILYGLFEVIERDALSLIWLNKLSVPKISIINNKKLLKIVDERLSAPNTTIHIFNITMDITITTSLCLMVNKNSEGLALSTGSATHLDPNESVFKALKEAAQGRLVIKLLSKFNKGYDYKDDFSDVRDFENHVHFYGKLKNLHKVNFLLNVSQEQDICKMENLSTNNSYKDLELCLNIFRKKNMDVIVIDLTSPDVKELGLHVIRVIIPNMQPLNSNYNYRFLGGKRLYEVPNILRLKNNLSQEGFFNNDPHPFG